MAELHQILVLWLVVAVGVDGSSLSRIRKMEGNLLNSQAKMKSDINSLFDQLDNLTGSWDTCQNAGEGSCNDVLEVETNMKTQQRRVDTLEETLKEVTKELAATKAALAKCDRIEPRYVFREAFLEEKKARKEIERLHSSLLSELTSRFNDSLASLGNRLEDTDVELTMLEDRIIQNEAALRKVDDDFTDDLISQVKTVQSSLTATEENIQERFGAISSAICDFSPPCSDWTNWSVCSAECESSGTQTRTRKCREENYSFCDSTQLHDNEELSCKNPRSCCPDDYDHVDSGYCFKVFLLNKRNSEVKTFCESRGDHLVSLTSDSKVSEFAAYAKTQFGTQGWSILIDGQKKGGEWLTSYGSPLPFINWKNGEPAATGDCVYIKTSTREWATIPCNETIFSFVCEKGNPLFLL